MYATKSLTLSFLKKSIKLSYSLTNESKAIPSRSEMIESLNSQLEFDVLVIGGGATGCGVALGI